MDVDASFCLGLNEYDRPSFGTQGSACFADCVLDLRRFQQALLVVDDPHLFSAIEGALLSLSFSRKRIVGVGPFFIPFDGHQARINLLGWQPGLSGREDTLLAEEISGRNLILLVGLSREPSRSDHLAFLVFDRGRPVGRSELFVITVERIKDSGV